MTAYGSPQVQAQARAQGSLTTLDKPVLPADLRRLFDGDQEAAPAPEAPPQLDGLRVLLVEDSIDSQRILSALLGLAGANVTVAGDGMVALKQLGDGAEPHLVIMDIQMPGMDGIEATRLIRERGFRGRILALTAAALKGERDRAIGAGCDGFFVKPISRQELVDMCLTALPPRDGAATA